MSAGGRLDCFKYCSRTLKLLGYVVVPVVVGIVLFTHYAVLSSYAPLLSSESVPEAIGGAVVCTGFTMMIGLILWAYIAAVVTDPGRVPAGWHPFSDEHEARIEFERLSNKDFHVESLDPRMPRFCKRCQAWKPQRAHHCSASGRCVLKMDHYCAWVANCVGLLNLKAFLLFVFYTFLGSLAAFLLLLGRMIHFFSGDFIIGTDLVSVMVVFMAGILDFSFALALGGFMVMYLHLLNVNKTNVEANARELFRPWPYSRGLRRNLGEVFGRRSLRWLVPVYTREEVRLLLGSYLDQRALDLKQPFAATPHKLSSIAIN